MAGDINITSRTRIGSDLMVTIFCI